MLSDLFIVIITFGVIFVLLSSLGQGMSTTIGSLKVGFKGLRQSSIMMLLAKFIILPIILIVIASFVSFGSTGHQAEIRMAICVCALTAGAPFIPMVSRLGKGNLAYAASASFLLTILTIIILPFTLPTALKILGTGVILSIESVALPLIVLMLFPLIAGLLIRARYPDLAKESLRYTRPVAIAALLLETVLYLIASLSDFTVLYLSGVFIFALAVPIISIIVSYFLSPPFRLRPLPATDPQRDTNITTFVSIALSNISAITVATIFILSAYSLAGFAMTIIGIATIIILVLLMAELGRRYERETASTNKKPISNTKSPKS